LRENVDRARHRHTSSDIDAIRHGSVYSIVWRCRTPRSSPINARPVLWASSQRPNFEATDPLRAAKQTINDVTVQVSDGGLTDTQAIAVDGSQAGERNPLPVLTSKRGRTARPSAWRRTRPLVTTVDRYRLQTSLRRTSIVFESSGPAPMAGTFNDHNSIDPVRRLHSSRPRTGSRHPDGAAQQRLTT
jgi:hypothetical protein